MYRPPGLAILGDAVDPSRKRKIRLGVALSVAVLLAVALIYVSFNAASNTAEPTQIMAASPGQNFEMNATVVPGTIKHKGETIDFEVEDRDGGNAMPVSYTGVVPDPFRGGREIILTGQREAERHLRRRTGIADHQVPVEVHDQRERNRKQQLQQQ